MRAFTNESGNRLLIFALSSLCLCASVVEIRVCESADGGVHLPGGGAAGHLR